jgi:hypothetical protein
MGITRRQIVKGGVGLSLLSTVPYARNVFAQTENDRIVAAAKPLGKVDVRGMIWSNYYIPMQPSMEEFRKSTFRSARWRRRSRARRSSTSSTSTPA